MAQFKVQIKGLNKLNTAFKKSPKIVFTNLSMAVKTSINIIRPMMVRNAPVDTSKLRQNIYARTSGLKGEVGPNLKITPYAIYVHEGTRPHIIRAVNKKVLADTKRGIIFGPVVHHPGTRPNPFVKRTAEEAVEPVNQIFRRAADKIADDLTK